VGKTREWWTWRIEHHWRALGEGVALSHRGTPTEDELLWAAVLHGGPTAAVSGDASLRYFGVKRLTVVRFDLAVPERLQLATVDVPGLVVKPHRVRHLEKWSAGHPDLRLVHVHAAVLHAAAWADTDEEAEKRIAMSVQQRKTTPALIRTVLPDMPRLRRRALILEVLDDVEHGAHANSELEFLRFCRRNRLPEPDQLQVAVRAGGMKYLDGRYRNKRITIEVDGAHHRWAEQWEADALRSLQLAVATRGDQVIRITRAMMRHHETEVAALLRQLLL
jgi:very-short-patch-repair endonuclease